MVSGLWRQKCRFKPSRDASSVKEAQTRRGCSEQCKQMDAKKDYREGCPFSILAQASLSETVRLKMSESALDSRSRQK
jgi:hypothetical protein